MRNEKNLDEKNPKLKLKKKNLKNKTKWQKKSP